MQLAPLRFRIDYGDTPVKLKYFKHKNLEQGTIYRNKYCSKL